MSQRVRKAVIPAAGYGTRFLPFTKSSPKEILPIVDKPVIQFVVEEAVSAGIEEIIFITSSNKRALEDYFDYNYELEAHLKELGKIEQYELIRKIPELARFVYVRQKEARGNGHAVMCAKDLIGDEPFLVLWGDEFTKATPSRSSQLIATFEQTNNPVVIATVTDKPEDGGKLGFIKTKSQEGDVYTIESIVEKPGVGLAPSNLASIGGYVLTPDIFSILENLPAHNGEIWLPEAINELAHQRTVLAKRIDDITTYDTGSKFGFIKANIDYGLEHSETRDELLAYIEQLRET